MSTSTRPAHRDESLPPGSTVDLPADSRPRLATLWSAPLALPPGSLACRSCGIAVPVPVVTDEDGTVGVVDGDGPGERVVLDVTETATRVGVPDRTGHPRPLARVEFTICEPCHERSQAQRGGWRLDRLIYTRHALAALGVTPPRSMPTRVLVHHLADLDVDLAWAARFVPVMPDGADLRTCNLRPWSHLRDEDRAILRKAYSAALADHVAVLGDGDVSIPPPAPSLPRSGRGILVPDGCMMCGRAEVRLTASEVAASGGLAAARVGAWRPFTASSTAMGGPGSPDPLVGSVCAPCAAAVESVGSHGSTSMTRAWKTYLRSVGRGAEVGGRDWVEDDLVTGVVGWAGLVHRAERLRRPRPRPNSEPWAHIRVG